MVTLRLRNTVTSGKTHALKGSVASWFEEYRPQSQATWVQILSHAYCVMDNCFPALGLSLLICKTGLITIILVKILWGLNKLIYVSDSQKY